MRHFMLIFAFIQLFILSAGIFAVIEIAELFKEGEKVKIVNSDVYDGHTGRTRTMSQVAWHYNRGGYVMFNHTKDDPKKTVYVAIDKLKIKGVQLVVEYPEEQIQYLEEN